jgi:Plasmid replication region DNA-binding N-term
MGRTSEITFEAVATVCTDLVQQGKRPTFALLKEQLGGSYEVLKRHLDRWQEESTAGARYALPHELAADLGIWFQQAKGQAKAEATHWLDLEKTALQVKEQQWKDALDLMRSELDKASDQQAQMGHDLSIKTLQASHAIEKATRLAEDLAAANEQVVALNAKCEALAEQLSARIAELQSERQRHTHELAIAEERTRGTEKAILMRHHAEVELQKSKQALLEKTIGDLKFKLSLPLKR